MRSCIFSIITPVFSVTWSSEISTIYWFATKKIYENITVIAENSCAASCFFENHYIFFRIIWWIKSPKEQHLFEIENMKNSIYEIVLIHHDHLFLSRTLNFYIFVIFNITHLNIIIMTIINYEILVIIIFKNVIKWKFNYFIESLFLFFPLDFVAKIWFDHDLSIILRFSRKR